MTSCNIGHRHHAAALLVPLVLPLAVGAFLGTIDLAARANLSAASRFRRGYAVSPPVTRVIAVLLVLAGAIHLALVPGHFVEDRGLAILFFLNGATFLFLGIGTCIWKMIDPRYKHSLVVLADGTVLAVDGSSIYSEVSQKGVLDAESWNPDNGDWALMAPMHDLRMCHSTALLLPDGRVLVAGGDRMSPVPDYQTAEIYSPPYLFKGPRPDISNAPVSTTAGTTFTIQTSDAARIKSVALVRLGSVIHTFDSDQRYINLAFITSGGTLKAQTPANPNIAPPGITCCSSLTHRACPRLRRLSRCREARPWSPSAYGKFARFSRPS